MPPIAIISGLMKVCVAVCVAACVAVQCSRTPTMCRIVAISDIVKVRVGVAVCLEACIAVPKRVLQVERTPTTPVLQCEYLNTCLSVCYMCVCVLHDAYHTRSL